MKIAKHHRSLAKTFRVPDLLKHKSFRKDEWMKVVGDTVALWRDTVGEVTNWEPIVTYVAALVSEAEDLYDWIESKGQDADVDTPEKWDAVCVAMAWKLLEMYEREEATDEE